MEYTEKLVYLSNQWYNDGLKKSGIRDLTGAITSLRKSLQYNRDNIASRNLLGLVYYGRGEVSEALVEWIISKNIRTQGNIANYFIKKVQESPGELETVNQAVRKYNQCLAYCRQDGEDIAAIQLKKVIASHPAFLKAYQLLALIYMHTEQYAKARQLIRKAHKIDTTDETTLRYMYEIKQLNKEKSAKPKTQRVQTVSYNLGNETIIHPVSSTLKDNAHLMTFVNILTGLAVGAALVWFLAVPTVKRNMAAKTNQEIIAYSEQIAALKSEADIRTKELEQYKEESAATASEREIAQATKSSYDALVSAIEHYNNRGYDRAALAKELLSVRTASLGETGKTVYDAMAGAVFPQQCASLYPVAVKSYEAVNYARAQECLESITAMDERYQNGEALFMLMDIYRQKNETEKAAALCGRINELFPGTDVAARANEKMGGGATSPQ